jgi:2-aminoadipate transaminase
MSFAFQQPPAQNTLRPGVIELRFGEPDPALLPAGRVAEACAAVLAAPAGDALSYGANEGPLRLREALAARIRRIVRPRTLDLESLMITGGTSQAIDLCLTMLTAPGDAVLVENTTYDLAVRILRDHPVEVVPVPIDEHGLVVEEVAAVCGRTRAAGHRPRLLYTIPTYHNPTGVSLPLERRRRLVEIAVHQGLTVLEDDAYRELGFSGKPAPSLWRVGEPGSVIRLGSFSKTIAPGLRAGWLVADPPTVARLAGSGLVESGGAVSQFSASVVAPLLESGFFDEHLAVLRASYASRRDALAGALREQLPAGFSFAKPAGGFFIWVSLPQGLKASALLATAEAHGVSFFPGCRFALDSDDSAMRLAFSLYSADVLAEGARRLGAAAREALAG